MNILEEALKEFDEEWYSMGKDWVVPGTEEFVADREKVKAFLSSKLTQAREQGYREAIEKATQAIEATPERDGAVMRAVGRVIQKKL